MLQRETDGGEERRYQKMLTQRNRRLNIRTLHQKIFHINLQADIILTTSITESLMVCFIRICVETLSAILTRHIDYHTFTFADKSENVLVSQSLSIEPNHLLTSAYRRFHLFHYKIPLVVTLRVPAIFTSLHHARYTNASEAC